MGDQPTKLELLRAVQRFLEEELLPDLEGVHRFHTRVAANAVAIVARELELEGEHLRAQFGRLRGLLGGEGEPSRDLAELDEQVTRLERDLCERIRDGAADDPGFREPLLDHLRATTRERLAVANPRHR